VQALLAERARTGASYRELSERSGIPVPTLAWWQRRLGDKKRGGATVELTEIRSGVANLFAPAMVEVVLRDGVVVRVPPGVDPERLRGVLAALDRQC
jgi:hypothetical protein